LQDWAIFTLLVIARIATEQLSNSEKQNCLLSRIQCINVLLSTLYSLEYETKQLAVKEASDGQVLNSIQLQFEINIYIHFFS